jgi:subtilisin-like proprotein convertase family protein
MGTTLRNGIGALLLACLLAASVSAQITETETASPNAAVTDDGYIGLNDGNDGTGADAGMTCSTLDFSGSAIASVTDVTMDLALSHTWVGDLVVKVKSPAGTILAPLNRPGHTGPDDGTGGPGDSANLASASPIGFDDDSTKTAESMGDESALSSYVVCQDAPFNCDYSPSPDGAFNSVANFAGFAGEDPDGLWEVCVGDAAALDQGTFASVTLAVTGDPDPPPGCSLSYVGNVTATFTASPRRVTISGRVANSGPGAKRVSITVNYDRNGGPPAGSIRFGPANVPPTPPAGVPFNLQVNVPNAAPAGTYNLLVELEDKTTTPEVCDDAATTVTISAPRVGEDPNAEFEAASPDLLAAATPAPAEVAVSPNPLSRSATVSFTLAEAAQVRLAVYDVLGREVAVLVDGQVEAGSHTAVFEAGTLASGTYVYRLVADGQVQTGRLTVAR